LIGSSFFILFEITINTDRDGQHQNMDWTNKEVVMRAVAMTGAALQLASKTLKADKEVVMAAVAQNGHTLQNASNALKSDKEVVMTAVAKNGNALKHASKVLKGDKTKNGGDINQIKTIAATTTSSSSVPCGETKSNHESPPSKYCAAQQLANVCVVPVQHEEGTTCCRIF